MNARFSSAAGAVCLSLAAIGGGMTAMMPVLGADAPAAAVPAAKPAQGTPAAPSGDAAARHAKRTACLKEARTKKLLGAEKTSFLKTCIAVAPSQRPSASASPP